MEQPRFSVVANGLTTYYSTQEQIVEDLDRISRQVKMGQMNAQELHVDYKSMSFFEFFESRTNDRIMKHTTRLRFVSTLNLLKNEATYLEHFEDLTPEKLCRFDEYLRRRKAHGSHLMADTSIAKIHNTIKTIIREAIVRKIIASNPYDCLHIVKGRCKERVFLTREELDRFIAYQPESQERREVKDCFLVSCYTGLAYVDLFNVDFTKRKQVQGHWLVYNHRQKTNERNTIVLLPIVLDILKKYDFKLPHRSNVGYNRQLSILCKEMDLGKKLTTHCARHHRLPRLRHSYPGGAAHARPLEHPHHGNLHAHDRGRSDRWLRHDQVGKNKKGTRLGALFSSIRLLLVTLRILLIFYKKSVS